MRIVLAFEHIRRLVGSHSQMVTEVARHLQGRGHDVCIVCDSVLDAQMYEDIEICARRAFQSGESHRLLMLRRWARRIMPTLRPDVSLSFFPAISADVLCPSFGWIATRLQREHQIYRSPMRAAGILVHPNVIETRCVERAIRRDPKVRSIMVMSDEMRAAIATAAPWSEGRIDVIPGASPIEPPTDATEYRQLREDGRAIIGADPGDVVFLWAAKRGMLHGRGILTQAFGDVVSHGHGRAMLVVAGEGQWAVHHRAVERECETRVRVLGRTAAMECLLAASDIGLCPAIHSTLGRFLWECVAFGKPVIATETAAGAHRLRHESGAVAGCFVPPLDAPALRDAMIALMDDATRANAEQVSVSLAPTMRFESFVDRIEAHLSKMARDAAPPRVAEMRS